MDKSQEIKSLAAALVKFQNEVQPVTRDGANPFFKSKYATLGNIIETIRTPMVKNGLSFSQLPVGENGLTTILFHSSGEYISATVTMKPKDATPQGQGSAITYMRRYALSALLGLNTDEEDDGQAASRTPVSYDKEPIPDDAVPTVHIGGESAPWNKPAVVKKVTVTAQKKTIRELLDRQSLVDLESKQDYFDACLSITGLNLVEENYPDIISKLEELQSKLHIELDHE